MGIETVRVIMTIRITIRVMIPTCIIRIIEVEIRIIEMEIKKGSNK